MSQKEIIKMLDIKREKIEAELKRVKEEIAYWNKKIIKVAKEIGK